MEKKNNDKNQDGFALVFALFLVIVLMLMATGSFLSMSRNQRQVERTTDQVQINWAAEAVIDRANKLFRDYTTTKGQYPPPEALNGEVAGARDTLANPPSEIRDKFQEFLQDWFNQTTVKSAFPNVELVSITVIFKARSGGGGSGDAWRQYELQMTFRNAITKIETSFDQHFKITTGALYDYASFFNEDLEISAGTDAEFQGPIFANGYIYVMPGAGKRITFRSSGTDYAIATPKNIFYGFKRVAAKNYLIAQNPVYASSIPKYLRTDDSALTGEGLEEFAIRSRRVSGSKLHVWNPSNDPGLDSMEIWEPNNYGLGAEYNFLPWWYILRNEIRNTTIATSTANDPNRNMVFVNNTEIVPFRYFGYGSLAWPNYYFQTSYQDKNTYSRTDLSPRPDAMSFSGMVNYQRLPRMAAEWTPENPKMDETTGPLQAINSSFPNQLAEKGLISLVRLGVNEQVLDLGTATGNNHLLIEKITSGDEDGNGTTNDETDLKVRKAKLQSQTEIDLLCTDGTPCNYPSQYTVRHFTDENRETFETLSPNWLSRSSMYDYRLGKAIGVLNVDVGLLTEYLEGAGQTPDFGNNGYGIYIEVCSPQGSAKCNNGNDVSAVRLVNAKVLPRKGLTFVTNGRLWIQGDYNTYDSSKGASSEPAAHCWAGASGCHVPPAAVFSDSFGVLSKEWSDSYGSGTTLQTRNVAQAVTVNTAVITGYLRSQLEKMFPNCTSPLKNGKVDLSKLYEGCLDASLHGNESNVWVKKEGNTWMTRAATCPGGLNENGMPNDPRNCNLRIETDPSHTWTDSYGNEFHDAGVSYYRRIYLIAEMFRLAYREAHGNAEPTAGDYNSRLPGASTHAILAGIDWAQRSGDQALVDCSANNACWTAFLTALSTVDVGGAQPVDVRLYQKDSVYQAQLICTIPLGGGGTHQVTYTYQNGTCTNTDGTACICDYGPCIKNIPVNPGTACTLTILNPGDKTIPKWDIPFNVNNYATYHSERGFMRTYYGAMIPLTGDPPPPMPIFPMHHFNEINVSTLLQGYRNPPTFYGFCAAAGPSTKRFVNPNCTDEETCPWYWTEGGCTSYYIRPVGGVDYVHGRAFPLYETRYSGGLENLINFQEDWQETIPLNFSGVLTKPWDSEELVSVVSNQTVPAYWRTSYYSAPIRNYDYNEDLRNTHPPASPKVRSVNRGRLRETSS